MARKRILVTGANGFVGAHVVRGAIARGFAVVADEVRIAKEAYPNYEWNKKGQTPIKKKKLEIQRASMEMKLLKKFRLTNGGTGFL